VAEMDVNEELKKLFISREENIDLQNSMKKFFNTFGRAKALLYTPKECHLAFLDCDSSFFRPDKTIVVGEIFEARIFNETAELRWLKRSGGADTAVVLSKSNQKCLADEPSQDVEVFDFIHQHYLLWGEELESKTNEGQQQSKASPKEWTRFAAARIGSFYVPVTLNAGETRARFTAVEYLKKYADGNVAVCDERLTGIEGYAGEK
jgi:CRISPR-associated protein (TIGR03984 family)